MCNNIKIEGIADSFLHLFKVAELRKFGPRKLLPEEAGTHKVTLKPHPNHVVESKCFRAVQAPPPSYHPALRPELIKDGSLSDIQYESVVYAGMRHSRRLGDGVSRAAYFIGDGTGIGKGRQLAAIILVRSGLSADANLRLWTCVLHLQTCFKAPKNVTRLPFMT